MLRPERLSPGAAQALRSCRDILLRVVAARIENMGTNVFGVCAVAANSDAMFGTSRMFGAFSGRYFQRVEVFRSVRDAEAALNVAANARG